MAGAARMGVTGRWAIRLVGSAVFLALIFWLLPLDAVGRAIRALSLADFLGVLAAFLAAHVVAAAKWWLLLGRALPYGAALRAHYAGLAANLCLPGAIGGDAVRAALAHKHMRDGPRLAAAAAADRLIDLMALAAISLAGLALARAGGDALAMALRALLIVTLTLAACAALPRLLPLLWRIAPRLPGRGMGTRLAAAFGDLARRPGRLAAAFAIAALVQGALVVMSWWLAVAAGASFGLALWAFAWPLAKIAAILPVSLNGLGLREGVLAALLVPFGAAAATVVAAGLAWQGVMFCAGAIGAAALALSTRGPAAALERARQLVKEGM